MVCWKDASSESDGSPSLELIGTRKLIYSVLNKRISLIFGCKRFPLWWYTSLAQGSPKAWRAPRAPTILGASLGTPWAWSSPITDAGYDAVLAPS